MGGADHGTAHGGGDGQEPERVVIRDKRRIDPTTGQVRTPPADSAPTDGPADSAAPAAAAASSAADPGVDDTAAGTPADENATLLAERTADLQRLSAEYANYRKRAERDRLAAGELAVGRVLTDLLPVLDDIDRAREHGDLTGGLKAVADRLQDALTKMGLESFGAVGDEFDPARARGGPARRVARRRRAHLHDGHASGLPAPRPAAATGHGRGQRPVA